MKNWFHFFVCAPFSLALLRYNQHIILDKFKVYNVMNTYTHTHTHTLCNFYHKSLVNTLFTSYNYHFIVAAVMVRILKVYSYPMFQVYNINYSHHAVHYISMTFILWLLSLYLLTLFTHFTLGDDLGHVRKLMWHVGTAWKHW